MLISNDAGKLTRFKNAKLLRTGEDVSALAIPYHIGVAATLLSLDQQENKASLILLLDRLSRQLGEKGISADLARKLGDGTWDVFDFVITNLPGVEAADINETERRVRAAVAMLIAA